MEITIIDKPIGLSHTCRAMPETVKRRSRSITLGGLSLGGEAPIRVQSMTNTDTRQVEATWAQIDRLVEAGCEIVRVAVVDDRAVEALARIRERTPVPLVADIHFDHRLAVASLQAGADGVRINPGNIGGLGKTLVVAEAAAKTGGCLRVGVNAGSLEKELLEKYGRPSPQALAESALISAHELEKAGFYNFKVSLKSSSVDNNIEAARLFAEESRAPLHIGLTEAGPLIPGVVKSALGIGFILARGIGDTIRVSLTGDPVVEVKVGYEILRALGLRERGVEIISCPTCGRTEVDLVDLVARVEQGLSHIETPLKVAVMGCVVNGPGEAREADLGVAGGRGTGLLFRRGQKVGRVPEEEIVAALAEMAEAEAAERSE